MAAFIIRRVVWTIPVILLVIFMIFMMMRQIEGNPFRRTERAVPPQVQANLERKFNLDEPVYMQYLLYVKGVFTFDLGPSLTQTDRSVTDIVKEHFPRSLKLGLLAFMWAILFGIPAGVIAALRPNTLYDYILMLFSNIGFALPAFFVATLFIYYFAVKASLVPTNGWPLGFWEYDSRVLLPSLALALPGGVPVSLSFLAIPAWGLIASTLWLGEDLPLSLVLGGVLILLGVAAIAVGDTRRR